MGREQTLLQRIAEIESSGSGLRRVEATATEDLDALMDSVRLHLGRLLNARHEMSEAVPDYGLPAMNDLIVDVTKADAAIEDAIRSTIEKYEPRLRRVKVSRVEDEEHRHTMVFRVDAILVSRSGEHKVWYQTEVTGAGEFEVSD